MQLSQVMHQQNGDVEAVGNALDGGNVVVVVAVHSRLSGAAFGVPHLLQRVNDDQLGGGMLGQEIRNLLLQPAADQPGGHGEIQVVRGAVGKIVEPVFDAALGVLKAQIEHIALQCRQPPNGISLRHLQPQPQHQPAFADLAGTADDIDALRNEASTMNIVLLIGVDSKVSASTVFSLLPIEISPL